jgi:hypothetical protein
LLDFTNFEGHLLEADQAAGRAGARRGFGFSCRLSFAWTIRLAL